MVYGMVLYGMVWCYTVWYDVWHGRHGMVCGMVYGMEGMVWYGVWYRRHGMIGRVDLAVANTVFDEAPNRCL